MRIRDLKPLHIIAIIALMIVVAIALVGIPFVKAIPYEVVAMETVEDVTTPTMRNVWVFPFKVMEISDVDLKNTTVTYSNGYKETLSEGIGSFRIDIKEMEQFFKK